MVASVWESQCHGLRLEKHEDGKGVVTLPTPSAEEHLSNSVCLVHCNITT